MTEGEMSDNVDYQVQRIASSRKKSNKVINKSYKSIHEIPKINVDTVLQVIQ